MLATQQILTPEEQIANVQACLLPFVRELHQHRKTLRDAQRLVDARLGRGVLRRIAWAEAAYAAVSCLAHWRELKRRQAAGQLRPVVVDELPF